MHLQPYDSNSVTWNPTQQLHILILLSSKTCQLSCSKLDLASPCKLQWFNNPKCEKDVEMQTNAKLCFCKEKYMIDHDAKKVTCQGLVQWPGREHAGQWRREILCLHSSWIKQISTLIRMMAESQVIWTIFTLTSSPWGSCLLGVHLPGRHMSVLFKEKGVDLIGELSCCEV